MLSKCLKNKQKNILIVGDLNIDWFKNSNNKLRLKDLMNEFKLQQLVDAPTRVTSSSSTLIDHALTNIDCEMIDLEVIGTGLSDHYAQKITIKSKEYLVSKIQDDIFHKTFYDTRPENLKIFNFMLSKENWNTGQEKLKANEKLHTFLSTLKYYFRVTCPLKKKRLKHFKYKKHWLTRGILISSQKLKELDLEKKINKSPHFIEFYKQYKRIYRKVIKAAKAMQLKKQLTMTDNLSKEAWKIIDTDRKKKTSNLPDKIPNANSFNQFFANVGQQKYSQISQPFLQLQSHISCSYTLSLRPTNSQEVYKIIKALKNSNSTGHDGFSHKVIRHCASYICEPLADCINTSFAEGIFPNELKTTIIRPIYKDGPSNLPENWRPIANTSTFSKIYEYVFLSRLINFLFQHNLLCKDQFGFVKGKSTTGAIVDFVTRAITALDSKYKAVGVFLDLQKAFDCVSHRMLFDRLYKLGVRGVSLDWIKSYLQSRIQRVVVKDDQSTDIELNFGIPQGSVLGPILFILYINSISKTFDQLHITMYADDISILLKNKSWNELEAESFIQLTNLYQYLNSNNLHVNSTKTNCINFTRNNKLQYNPWILMNQFELPFRTEVKYLGLIFDERFTWTAHVNSLCSRLSSQLFLLSRFSKYENIFLMKLIYNALIESRLRYGVVLWGSTSRTNFLRVFYLQKRAIRIMARLNRRSSCRNYFKSLKILTLTSIYIYEVLIFYKFRGNKIETGADIHNYKTRHRHQHRQIQHRLQLAASLPQNVGPKLFNVLPENIKLEHNQVKFENELKNYLLERACYSLDEFFDL